jgi:ribosomal protein S18 acetylase RimI-like enzyme
MKSRIRPWPAERVRAPAMDIRQTGIRGSQFQETVGMRNLSHQSYLNEFMSYDDLLWDEFQGEGIRKFSVPGCPLIAGFVDSPWDKDVMGMPVTKVQQFFYDGDVAAVTLAPFARGLDEALRPRAGGFAQARLDFRLYPLIGALEDCGWRLADTLNLYHCEPGKAFSVDASGSARNASRSTPPGGKGSAAALQLREPAWDEVAAAFPDPSQYFPESRIMRDSRLSTEVKTRFFTHQLKTIFTHSGSVKLGAYKDGKLAGLALGDKDTGVGGKVAGGLGFLWFNAIRPEWSGQGLSRPLLRAFLSSMGNTCGHIEIGTQADNLAANRLYQGMGLKLAGNAVTLHRWYDRTSSPQATPA